MNLLFPSKIGLFLDVALWKIGRVILIKWKISIEYNAYESKVHQTVQFTKIKLFQIAVSWY